MLLRKKSSTREDTERRKRKKQVFIENLAFFLREECMRVDN